MSPCIEWDRARSKAGYGQTSVKGKVVYVHRLAWEQRHGPIPAGKVVMHACDNRACYNLDHLSLGTIADNNRDMRAKGRGSPPPHHRGEANSAARLTRRQVETIRLRPESAAVVADDLGIHISTVYRIRSGETWR